MGSLNVHFYGFFQLRIGYLVVALCICALLWLFLELQTPLRSLFLISLFLCVFCSEQRSPRSRERGRREIDNALTNALATSNLVSLIESFLVHSINSTVFVCFLVEEFFFFFFPFWVFFSCFFFLSLLPRNGELHLAFA